ncbi:MAG: hypothetical protein ACR2O4_02125, partial [Hyphomicrobiaceae bacterium]
PYGFGGVFDERERRARLQAYLNLPLTIYLGTADSGSTRLVQSAAANRQGATRYARGLTVFRAGRARAKAEGWDFNWRLVEVPGVGHSSRRMLAARQVLEAFGLEERALPEPAQ